MLKRLLVTCLAASSLGLSATSVTAAQYATAIFDKTGSMRVTRPADGKTRCAYGKELFMDTVGTGIERADFLNVKTFGIAGEINSLSGGFVDVRGWNRYIGPGKDLYDNIQAQLNQVSCNSWATALGDAICEAADELRAQSGNHERRIGLVTDAGENGSAVCRNPGGGTGTEYVYDHVIPKITQVPPVRLNLTILQPGGNTSWMHMGADLPDKEAVQYEYVPNDSSIKYGTNVASLTEAETLVLAAELSGGGAIVIGDNEICTSNCDPESQDPPGWGGGW